MIFIKEVFKKDNQFEQENVPAIEMSSLNTKLEFSSIMFW